MAMVPYKKKKNNQSMTRRTRGMPVSFNPNQLVYDLGFGAVEGAGNLAVKAVKGIVSAFQNRGASRQEISAIVAPLAKSLTYTSRKPKFTRAEGGLAIEHIENITIQHNDHSSFMVDSNLFIWLKSIANQFEEYQIKMWFAWNPICPATTTGQVLMAFDYDPSDVAPGSYTTASDYFNTADHCIGAIWAPGALSPQRSGWLKTGGEGDARLYSPGRFHIDISNKDNGYLTVKYQVSLRKPQPSSASAEARFVGRYVDDSGIFAHPDTVSGDAHLIEELGATELVIAPTPGYKLVIWSTDASVASIVPNLTAARQIGVRTGNGASFVCVVKPGIPGVIAATVTSPGSSTGYAVSITQMDQNPLQFDF